MVMTSCITHPERERLVIIRRWQVEFCDGNQCAAALLSFFEYWHSWKLDTDNHNRKSNDIAEMHGENRLLSEDIYQYHSLGELSDGILSLYGEKSISKAIKLLEEKLVISVHANPNPRFHYDKRQYFRFYPEVCNEWIKNSYKSRLSKSAPSTEQKCHADDANLPDAHGKISSLSGKNASFRTEINNKEQINKSINVREHLLGIEESKTAICNDENTARVIDHLQWLGMPAHYFASADDYKLIHHVLDLGATPTLIAEAYSQAQKVTAPRGKTFGLRYLVKVVQSMIEKSTQKNSRSDVLAPIPFSQPSGDSRKENDISYENDFAGGLSWMGDLVQQQAERK